MGQYELGAFRKIEVPLSYEKMEEIKNHVLEHRHILYVVHFDESGQRVKSIRGYMRATETESWYRIFVGEGHALADYMCFFYMVPDYNYEKKMVEPYDMRNNVLFLHEAIDNVTENLKNLKAEPTVVKAYLSEGPGDIANFGGPLECSLCERLMDSNSWHKPSLKKE